MPPNNNYIRHTIATIAYRFQSSMYDARDNFGDFHPGNGSRTTLEIINHMTQLLHGSIKIIEEDTFGYEAQENSNLQSEIDGFNNELQELDRILSNKDLDEPVSNRLLQGPLADILTHIGQLTLMRRLNGNPIGRGGYYKAPITIGKLSYF